MLRSYAIRAGSIIPADTAPAPRYASPMTGFSEDPQAPYGGAPRDKKSFLHWVQRQEGGRYEFKDGRVVMHPGSSKRHGQIIGDFVRSFGNRLGPPNWRVIPTEVAVEIGDDIRYPDVLVERMVDDGHQVSTASPVVLVEVLSPSSLGRDLNVKLAEYTSLASLEAYIVASQDEPIVWGWQRDAQSRAFPAKPTEISSRDGTIEISALELSLPLAELFRAIL